MSFLNPSRDMFSKPSLEQYEAEVVSNDDPSKLGRIKVRILEIHGTIVPNDKLPWAAPRYESGLGSASSFGTLHVPRVGSRVLVELEDIYSIFYIGVLRSVDRQIAPQLLEDYPHTYGTQDSAGNRYRVKLTTNAVEIHLVNGLQIDVDGNGNITYSTPGEQDATATKFTFNGDVVINGHLQVNGSIDATGNISDMNGSMQEMRTIFNGHVHPGVIPGGSSTQVSATPMT